MRRFWPILLAAVLTLGVFVGVRIRDTTPISLGFHWAQAGLAVVAVMLVFSLSPFLQKLSSRPRAGTQRADKTVPQIQSPVLRGTGSRVKPGMTILVMLLAAALPFLPFIDRELLDLATLVLIYALLASGLNIVVGFAGLLDLGFIAFFAIGAYTYGILGTSINFWLCLPLAALIAAFASLLLGLPVLRLRGDYFAIVTLGFGQIVYTLLLNWRSLTHGSQGIGGIARPAIPGLPPDPASRVILLYYIILILAAAVFALVARLRRLPIGRAWEALREDEIAASSLGLSRSRIKLAAYAISAAIAGLAGAFFAARQGFISPESFTFMDSAIVLAIVVLGGSGRGWGLLLAAALLIGLPEIIRPLADYRMLLFGAGMVIMMRVRPRGLFATRPVSVKL
jgi:branched-chain amino acid transport system permease protein